MPSRSAAACSGFSDPAGEVVDNRAGHDRHQSGRGLVAALVLLAPADDAVGGGEPVGAATGQQDGGHVLGVGERPERIGLPGPGAAALDTDAAAAPRRREHDSATGHPLGIAPVPHLEIPRELTHAFAFFLRLGRRRNRTWQLGQ
jgi:hypothetical protein